MVYPRNGYEFINDENDIINNVREFIKILNREYSSNIIKNIPYITYWSHFFDPKNKIEIFIPDIFLTYNFSITNNYPDDPRDAHGIDGGSAHQILSKYFKDIPEDKSLKDKLKLFVEINFEKNINKTIVIRRAIGDILKNIDLSNYKGPKKFSIPYRNDSDVIKRKSSKNKNEMQSSAINQIFREEHKNKTVQKNTIRECQIEELIDNVIRVKIGLRIFAKVLIPYVSDKIKHEYKNNWWEDGVLKFVPENQHNALIKGKLDVSNCLSLLISHWDRIFKKYFPGNDYQNIVRSFTHLLKAYRNINAHDGIDDTLKKNASSALQSMSLLCDAIDANEASDTIMSIINTLESP